MAISFASFAGRSLAQPMPAPAEGDLRCSIDTSAAARADTLASPRDRDGFVSLFDGTSFKGWWQNCQTAHSDDKTNGAVFRVDKDRKAIYSNQRNGRTGGLLATRKRFRHYDLVFDYWGGWGNDGGLFHRSTLNGRAWQTLMDYLPGRGFLGSYGEGYPVDFAVKPFNMGPNDTTVIIPGNAYKEWPAGHWTEATAARSARGEATGCATSGCTAADWRNNWKASTSADGWNTIRVRFYGGLSRGQSMAGDKVHMQSYILARNPGPFASVDSMKWIAVASDSLVLTDAQAAQVPAGPIGLQIHIGAGAFPNAKGTWYRNLKVRELDSLGRPVHLGTTGVTPETVTQTKTDMKDPGGRDALGREPQSREARRKFAPPRFKLFAPP